MARTILKIAQEAAERDATAPAPAALFGTNDRIARILRGSAHDTMREYLRRSGWQGMSELQSTWVFGLRKGIHTYSLPPDFLRVIPRTEQRNGWPLGLVGPTSPQSWAAWLYGEAAVTAPMGWRIRNNTIIIEPTPAAEELVVIEYISRYPVVSIIKDGDYDLSTVPPSTVDPVVPRDGWMNISSTLAQATLGSAGSKWGSAFWDTSTWGPTLDDVLKRTSIHRTTAPVAQVRRETFAADDDLPAFEDDNVLSLGMTFRLRRALGLPFAEHAAEFEDAMDVKMATDAGGARSFRLGSEGQAIEGQVPLGGGRWLVN